MTKEKKPEMADKPEIPVPSIERLSPSIVELPRGIDVPFEIIGSQLDGEKFCAVDGKGTRVSSISIERDEDATSTHRQVSAIATVKPIHAPSEADRDFRVALDSNTSRAAGILRVLRSTSKG